MKLSAMAQRLEAMSIKPTRYEFNAGDYWNACYEAAALLREAESVLREIALEDPTAEWAGKRAREFLGETERRG